MVGSLYSCYGFYFIIHFFFLLFFRTFIHSFIRERYSLFILTSSRLNVMWEFICNTVGGLFIYFYFFLLKLKTKSILIVINNKRRISYGNISFTFFNKKLVKNPKKKIYKFFFCINMKVENCKDGKVVHKKYKN